MLSLPVLSLLSAILSSVASATPTQPRAAAPSVTIKNGTLVGSDSGSIQSFLGIPFAQPPVGALRLKPPQSINQAYGTLTVTKTAPSCPQQFFQDDVPTLAGLPEDVLTMLLDTPLFQAASNAQEDCLTIDIRRPSNTTSSSALPVVFWIFGGGFELGASNMYDGTTMVQRSISLGKPIIHVAVNYRVAAFGFLAGKELQKDGSTNLGLRDQRLGLQWTAENIAAFGGDPDKVTIWGESAGAISVFDHTIINGGDNTYHGKPLFRGAIMDSGSVVPANDVDTAVPQHIYDTVVLNAGCSTAADTLSCLRSVPYETLLNAQNSVPNLLSYRSLDLSYLPRPDPSNNFFPLSPDAAVLHPNNASFAPVPIIIGDQEDEGTLFAAFFTDNITTTADLEGYLLSYFPNADAALIKDLVSLYPNDPAAGSPFRTGILNAIYPQYKRLAAILGDLTFTLTRRSYLSNIVATNGVTAYSYLASYFHGTPILGTFHATDIFNTYGNAQPVPAQTIQTHYVAFINSLDPNALGTPGPLITWPKWTNESRELMWLNVDKNSLLKDDFRQVVNPFISANAARLRV